VSTTVPPPSVCAGGQPHRVVCEGHLWYHLCCDDLAAHPVRRVCRHGDHAVAQPESRILLGQRSALQLLRVPRHRVTFQSHAHRPGEPSTHSCVSDTLTSSAILPISLAHKAVYQIP